MTNPDGGGWTRILSGVLQAKFGPGAIGRIGTIALAGMVVIAVLTMFFGYFNIWVGAGFAGFGIIFIFYCVHRAFNYAIAFPEASAMDGAQISRVLAQQGSMRRLEGVIQPPPFTTEVIKNPLLDQEKGEDQ